MSNHGRLKAKSPQLFRILSAGFFWFGVFFFESEEKGIIANKAGSRIRVKLTHINTPAAPKMPRSETGATFTGEKESNPPAVVRLVMRMAKPECPKA